MCIRDRLNNGTKLTTVGKPKLKGAEYHYKDAKGQDNIIPQSHVTEVLPASDEKKEHEFKVSEPYPKHHWWQFWK